MINSDRKTSLRMDMLPLDRLDIILNTLNAGGVLLYPTDTIWGLGCRADHEEAYQRLNKIKGRPEDQPHILLVDNIARLKQYVGYIHPRVETLLSIYERPITIVYKESQNLPSHCLAPDGSVAIRVVKDRFCQEIIAGLDYPITSTSPNTHGAPSPKHFGEIQSNILMQCDHVVQEQRSKDYTGMPSIIAKFTAKGELDFIRS